MIDAYLRGPAGARRRRRAARRDRVGRLVLPLPHRHQGRSRRLPEDSPLRGRVALASARVAYQRYRARFAGRDGTQLRDLGARAQRPLWASTGTKNPAYSDVLYVAELIGPDVINTMPEQTLRAFADHGQVATHARRRPAERCADPARTPRPPGSTSKVTTELEREGVQTFCDSYQELLDCIEIKLGTLDREKPANPTLVGPARPTYTLSGYSCTRQSAGLLALAHVIAIALHVSGLVHVHSHRTPPDQLASPEPRNTRHDRLRSCREAARDHQRADHGRPPTRRDWIGRDR